MVYQFIERTAIPAWGPQQGEPLLAAGTVAGAMDASFSNTSELEIFRLSSSSSDNDDSSDGCALQAIGKAEASARFQRLAWSASADGVGLGVLAGGLENGDVAVWDAAKIVAGQPAVLHASAAHSGAVGGLAFNPFAPNLLASGAANGEVLVWDVAGGFKSYSPGARSQRIDSVTDLAWNGQVQHILATASSSGALVVWDLRSRREVIALGGVGAVGSAGAGARPGVAAAEWNPQSATQLVTASADDANPVIMLWDLRNAHAPSQTLAGHQRGILSLSWCRKDAGLLLSSGKDNRTVCWDPAAGAIVGELPPASNWVYDVQWNQANPNLLSAASFDGRVSLYSLSRDPERAAAAAPQALDDPFAPQASSAFAPSLSLRKPPRWLARPCGAAFGFGGQLVHFGSSSGAGAGAALVSISDFVTEPQLAQQAQQLETLLQSGQAAELCHERVAQSAGSADQERSWQVLQLLFEADARDKLIRFLGFDKGEVKARIDELIRAKRAKSQAEEASGSVDAAAEEAVDEALEEAGEAVEKVEEEVPAIADNPFVSSTSLDADADDFFSRPIDAPLSATLPEAASSNASAEADDVRALRVAFSGAFRIYDKAKDIRSEDADGLITRAVLLGDIEAAVELCIEQELFADALILATCGSAELAARAQQAYFAKRAQQAAYVRLLHAIVTGDLTDVVANADLDEWDEVLALLCTYAQGDQFSTLCESLGRRLEAKGGQGCLGNAVLCYLASGNLDKVASIWIADQRQSEAGLARTKSLHSLIEKVSVFRKAVQFVDPALTAADNESSFVLASLYDCYVEYAQFLVSQGLIDIAVKYLDRVPDTYRCVLPTTGGEDVLAALRNRLALTTEAPWTAVSIGPVAQQQQQQQPIQQQPIQQQPIQQQPIQPVQPMQPMQPMQPAYGGYSQTYPAASTNMPAATHYPSQNMPSAATAAYPGGFAGMSQQQQQLGPYGGVGMFQPPPPMPVNPATIPTGRTPPPRRDDVPWNDPPPMLAKPAKRPSQAVAHAKPAAIVSPFPQGRDTPPPPPPQHLQQQQQQQPPQAMGPPRGGFVPSAAQIGKPLPPPPPPPSAPQLMQQQQQHPGMQQQPMQPGFVPQPQQQQMMPMMSSMQQTAPPPQSMRGQVVTAGPSTGTAGPAVRTGTPAAMSRDSVATAAALAAGAAAAAASASASASAAAKYPAGDRSHLPDAWKPAVSGLTAHLSRAKQFAAPGQKRMVEDAERRLNALFDLMNCDDVKMKDRLVPVFDQLVQAINSRHFPTALTLQAEIMALNPDITTNVVGVKHLVNVLKTLPM